jgi:hypothetical protein
MGSEDSVQNVTTGRGIRLRLIVAQREQKFKGETRMNNVDIYLPQKREI